MAHLAQHVLAVRGGRPASTPGVTDEHKQEYIPLSDFARAEQEIVRVEDPMGYDRNTARLAVENRMLSPRTQVLMWLAIDAVTDFFDADLCFESLDETNIQVSRWTLVPKFHNVRLTQKSPAKVESNMAGLAAAFEATILASADDVPAPFEVKHLIELMKGGDAANMLFLIRCHPSLVPLPNRPLYFSRMNSYAQDIRFSDPESYSYVTRNLCFPEFWDRWVEENEHLKRFYDDAAATEPYRPQGCTATGKSGADEVLRFHGDVRANTARLACHTPSPYGMRFTVTDTFRMLYSVMDAVLVSMAESLHRLGDLRHLELQPLFPGRVVKVT